MNWTHWLFVGAVYGVIAVGLGAFGAHALRDKLSEDLLRIYEVGNRYHFYHTFAILCCALVQTRLDNHFLKSSNFLFAIGILIFSGSLYMLALTGTRWLGAITPIGGVCFLAGWILLGIGVLRA